MRRLDKLKQRLHAQPLTCYSKIIWVLLLESSYEEGICRLAEIDDCIEPPLDARRVSQ